MANANQVIVNGETILDLRSDTVTPETLQKGYTAHDKSGTKITGTLEASSSGGAKETWVLNSAADYPSSAQQDSVIFNVDFTSNGLSFSSIMLSINLQRSISYDSTIVKMFGSWASEAYRKLTFDAPPTGALLTWLQANGVKQPDDTAVQDSKALTITSNGTVSVTPDAPYDALKKVDVTVDVANSSYPLKRVTITTNRPVNWYFFSPDEPTKASILIMPGQNVTRTVLAGAAQFMSSAAQITAVSDTGEPAYEFLDQGANGVSFMLLNTDAYGSVTLTIT